MSYYLDSTLDPLEEERFRKRNTRFITRLTEELHFTYEELEIILIIYYKILKYHNLKSGLTFNVFRDVLHSTFDMTDISALEGGFMYLNKGVMCKIVSMEMWARTMSLFLRGTLEEKIRYCFAVYDSQRKGVFGRIVMLERLTNAIIDEGDDVIKDFVDILIKKLDVDRDGRVTLDDYRKAVLQEPLLLESLGQCLPSRLTVNSFIASWSPVMDKF